MEKGHLRNLLLGGALAAGLGVAAERGCDKDTEKDILPKPEAEQIYKPKKAGTSTEPKFVVQDTREKIGTATTASKDVKTGDEQQDYFPSDLINAIRQSFGDIPVFKGEREESGAIPDSFFKSMAPDDNFLKYDGFGRYYITRYQGEQLSDNGETWYAYTNRFANHKRTR